MGKHRGGACLVADDFLVTGCIIFGLLCLSGVVADFSLHAKQPLLRILTIDVPLVIASLLCLLQAVPCCRQCVSSGVPAGFCGIFIGLGLGLASIFVWNDSSKEYVARQYEDSGFGYFHLKSLSRMNDIGSPLLVAAGFLVGFTSFLNEVSQSRKRSRYRTCGSLCGFILLCIVAESTIIVCSAFSVFILWPDIESHGWIFGHLLESPPRTGHPMELMAAFMISGVVVTWSTLLRRPVQGSGSFFRTLGLVCVFLCHVIMITMGLVELDLPPKWKIFPRQSVWMMFTTSASFLLLTLLAHSSVTVDAVSRRRDFDSTEEYILEAVKAAAASKRCKLGDTATTTASKSVPYPLPPPQPYPMDPSHMPINFPSVEPHAFYTPHYNFNAALQQHALMQQQAAVQRLNLPGKYRN